MDHQSSLGSAVMKSEQVTASSSALQNSVTSAIFLIFLGFWDAFPFCKVSKNCSSC